MTFKGKNVIFIRNEQYFKCFIKILFFFKTKNLDDFLIYACHPCTEKK